MYSLLYQLAWDHMVSYQELEELHSLISVDVVCCIAFSRRLPYSCTLFTLRSLFVQLAEFLST